MLLSVAQLLHVFLGEGGDRRRAIARTVASGGPCPPGLPTLSRGSRRFDTLGMPGTELVARRWRRYGLDRLYVTSSGGAQVGWADLESELMHPTSPEHLAALSQAVEEWKARSTGGWSAPPTPASGPLDPTESEPDVLDSPTSLVQASSSAALATPADVQDSAAQPPAERSRADLAANAPGAAARARARALRDAAPVRTFFARLVNLRTPERAWRIGADGEERVAAQLARLVDLDPRWRVLHAVPVGEAGADIDHLVIGPGGIFTLNTKHHPGAALWVGGDTFMVNGQRQPYVRKSRYEAGRAARLLMAAAGLPLRVDGIIVPVGARSLTIKTAPADVVVVPRRQLTAWLLNRRGVLDERTLAIVWEAARRSTTWQK